MNNTQLVKKLRQVEDEHFEEVEKELLDGHSQARRDRVMQMYGAARYADRLSAQCASDVMIFLMTVEEEKAYLEYGFTSFADFLNKSELSKYSKTQFYKRRELFLTEGVARYDLFEEWKVPVALRQRLLASGVQIEIDGDEIVIDGKERIAVANPAVVKAIIERQVKESLEKDERLEKQDRKIETLESKVERGESENEELRRNLDGMNETSRIQRAYLHALNAQLLFVEAVGELDDDEKAERGPEDLKFFAGQFYRLADAYGVSRPLSRQHLELEEKVAAMKPVEEMTETEKKETFTDRAMAKLAAEGFDDDLD